MAKHDDKNHAAQLAEHNIEPIQLVCVNLYPFQATISKPEVTVEDAIEKVLKEGYRTTDIMSEGKTLVGTREMGDLIVSHL